MPHLHPYHQILLRKAIVNEYKSGFDKELKGSEIKNLATNDLNVSYNTLRKLFLSSDENSNFQEYTLVKIIWYLSKEKNDFRFSEKKTQKYWYNFQKYFPVPGFSQSIADVHFNVLEVSLQDEIQQKALDLLYQINLKKIDFSEFTEILLHESEKNIKNEKLEKHTRLPIEGIYSVYRTDNKNRFLEKRYARIFQENGNLEFSLKTAMFNYESVVFEYNYPAIYLVFDNGMSKITFNLHCGNIRNSETFIGTFSHFSVSAGKADAGLVIFVKQNIPDSEFESLQGKSILINSQIEDKEELIIRNYFRAVQVPSFTSEPAINLSELEQITENISDNAEYKQNEIIKNYYIGSYFLYGKNKNDDKQIIKSPCRIGINENDKAFFEISGRTYSFKSKMISLVNNFLYIEIDNKLFNDKGFYTFSLSPTIRPKFITGIASFINAENKPMSRRVVLYKYSNSVDDFDKISNSRIKIGQTNEELTRYDKTIILHFEQLENNIIIDERIN